MLISKTCGQIFAALQTAFNLPLWKQSVLPVHRMCSSYPQKLLVPIWITDKELESVGSFRSWKRIPVVVYRWGYWHKATNQTISPISLTALSRFASSVCNLVSITLNCRHQKNGAVISRCSQPEISWWGWRNTDDEYLVTSIAKACHLDTGAKACRHRGDAPDSSDSDFGKAVVWFICSDSLLAHCSSQECNITLADYVNMSIWLGRKKINSII